MPSADLRVVGMKQGTGMGRGRTTGWGIGMLYMGMGTGTKMGMGTGMSVRCDKYFSSTNTQKSQKYPLFSKETKKRGI